MNRKTKEEIQAFPRPTNEYGEGQRGMTLRDWFAGRALAGCLAYSFNNPSWGDSLAEHCYGIADAMLKAREAKS